MPLPTHWDGAGSPLPARLEGRGSWVTIQKTSRVSYSLVSALQMSPLCISLPPEACF